VKVGTGDAVRLVRTHGAGVRATHWLNAVLLAGMWWSGLLIDWADRAYRLQLGSLRVTLPYPEVVFDVLAASGRLTLGIAWHLTLVWLFVGNGLVYVLLLARRAGWRRVVPERSSVAEAVQELRHLRRRPTGRDDRYSGAQRLAYTTVLLAAAGAVLTGVALWKPVGLAWLVAAFGGYQSARTVHLLLSTFFVLFTLIHVLQVARAGWNRARAMVVGYVIHPVAGGPGSGT